MGHSEQGREKWDTDKRFRQEQDNTERSGVWKGIWILIYVSWEPLKGFMKVNGDISLLLS